MLPYRRKTPRVTLCCERPVIALKPPRAADVGPPGFSTHAKRRLSGRLRRLDKHIPKVFFLAPVGSLNAPGGGVAPNLPRALALLSQRND